MHWSIRHRDPKTGVLKTTLNNSNITNIEAFDNDSPGARVYIKGHKVSSDGQYVTHQVMLTKDIIERAAKELGLLPKGEVK